jgi:hypothetical protein
VLGISTQQATSNDSHKFTTPIGRCPQIRPQTVTLNSYPVKVACHRCLQFATYHICMLFEDAPPDSFPHTIRMHSWPSNSDPTIMIAMILTNLISPPDARSNHRVVERALGDLGPKGRLDPLLKLSVSKLTNQICDVGFSR